MTPRKKLTPTPPPAGRKPGPDGMIHMTGEELHALVTRPQMVDVVKAAKDAQKGDILDAILDAFPAEAKAGPTRPGAVPAGYRVTSVHESEPRYKSEGRWLVVTRRGDLVQGHRFKTEAEALAFAATAENVE